MAATGLSRAASTPNHRPQRTPAAFVDLDPSLPAPSEPLSQVVRQRRSPRHGEEVELVATRGARVDASRHRRRPVVAGRVPVIRHHEGAGRAIAAELHRYRERHGAYPPSLVDAGIVPPSHGYGPWQYEPGDNGFSLAVGDYARDGFVLIYNHANGTWGIDR